MGVTSFAYPVRRRGSLALLLAITLGASQAASAPRGTGTGTGTGKDTDRAVLNDHRRVAGTRLGPSRRVLAISIEPRVASWSPSGDPHLVYTTHAWAESNGTPTVPGPYIRARVGDTLRLTVRNPTPRDLAVAGFGPDSIRVAAGAERTLDVPLTRAGTFWYAGVTHHASDPQRRPSPFPDRHAPRDETLIGAFIVDEATAPANREARERVFLVHFGPQDSAAVAAVARAAAVSATIPDVNVYINGASWPNTERLRYTVGDTVRWRVINTGFIPHPMHLHGFYFRVDAKGDGHADTVYAPGARRMAVTELVDGYATARLSWVPEREGNWLFHCHFVRHVAPTTPPPALRSQGQRLRAADSANGRLPFGPTVIHAGHQDDATAHSQRHMAGMVLGIHVQPRKTAAQRRLATPPASAQRLALWVTQRDSSAARPAGVGYIIQDGALPPAADSVRRPGSSIRVTQGRPVAITVHNTRRVPIAVHWHGIELESQYDGVGGWSGTPGAVTPPIAPGDSFVVRFTPPRAGTFIYHTHDETGRELAQGLYGALLVDAPTTDATRARVHPEVHEEVLVLGAGVVPRGRGIPPAPFVNADTGGTITVARSRTTRLRLVNISENDLREVRLVDTNGQPLTWRVVSKDGWAPAPAEQARQRPAHLRFGPGETVDVEVSADVASRATALMIETIYYPHWQRLRTHTARLTVRSTN